MGISSEFIHPFFKHDEDGNIMFVYVPTSNPFTDPFGQHKPEQFPAIKAKGLLTEDLINEQIIKALGWHGSGERLVDFLDAHLRNYNHTLWKDNVDQPFLEFLNNLVNSSERNTISKTTYKAVKNWIKGHSKIELLEGTTEDDELFLPPEHPDLTVKRVALWYIYQGKKIIRGSQADRIAKSHGFKSRTSGTQLTEDFLLYQEKEDRMKFEGKKARALVKDIEKVKQRLKGSNLQSAEEEILELKSNFF